MKNNILQFCTGVLLPALLLFSGISLKSCQDPFEILVSEGKPVSLSVSEADLVLNQKTSANTALSFNWTRGSNKATGSSIYYTLEIDQAEKNFSTSLIFDKGKGVFEQSFTGKDLNDLIAETWDIDAGSAVNLEARIIAKTSHEAVEDDISDVISFNVTTYKPVSKTLYFMGDAAPNGWNASKATPMIPDADDPTTFRYQGDLNPGQLKFITVLGTFLPSYQKGEDEYSLLYRTDDTQPNVNFEIAEKGKYNITMNLVDLTIRIELVTGPGYDVLYIFGTANPEGPDIENALEMMPNPDNLFKFNFDGVLKPGEFTIAVNKNADLGQDIFMRDPDDSSKVYLHTGGDPDHSSWIISEENLHSVKLNLSNYTISIEPLKLYIIGSATSVGWNIGDAIELEQDPTDWYIWRFQGPLTAGEFKFPVNRQFDWAQDMYMKDPGDPSKMYRHTGGEEDDEKWVFTEADAGNYLLTLNVLDLTIDIQKQ
ncbi:MAG: SusF/SusE family outer membrane protein [Bacteroidales bacterium]